MLAKAGMNAEAALEELWRDDDHQPLPRFDPASVEHLPAIARRWLRRVIEPGTPLYRAIRLRMHGTIKLSGWHEFEAEQVIRWGRGLVWQAKVEFGPLTIKGHDSVIDGVGEMRWKMLGLIPVMAGRGPDVDRSASARLELESVLLPTVLVDDDVHWSPGDDEHHVHMHVRVPGNEAELTLGFDERALLRACSCPRWGNPDGGEFGFVPFGGYWDHERAFQGVRITTGMRAGWWFGTDRYEREGEFFRAQIDQVELR